MLAPAATLASVFNLPAFDFPWWRALHGEQELTMRRSLHAEGVVRNRGRVEAIWDIGNAAVVDVALDSFDEAGELAFLNRSRLYVACEGGFGGERPPPRSPSKPPDREPDLALRSPTLPQQAALYRLSGDLNPIHLDPEVARAAGFPRPILHGLCTFGTVCRAVIDEPLGGDAARVKRYQARFAAPVLPGDTLVTELWREPDGFTLVTKVAERNERVLTHAMIELH